MKKIFIVMALLLAANNSALAQETVSQQMPPMAPVTNEAQDPVMQQVADLQTKWAETKYHGAGKEAQIAQMDALGVEAGKLTAAYPDRPEPKIWQAIILSSEAGLVKGLSALPKVKKAKALLEQAAKIDVAALQGSAYTSLGSLYYQVPGWPIAFGDNDKAGEYLRAALRINPDGIDPNYFYGDFLIHEEKYDEAIPVLEKALTVPDRPGRALADEGRRQEIRAALATARKKANESPSKKSGYN